MQASDVDHWLLQELNMPGCKLILPSLFITTSHKPTFPPKTMWDAQKLKPIGCYAYTSFISHSFMMLYLLL
jgi:hypothetical protein